MSQKTPKGKVYRESWLPLYKTDRKLVYQQQREGHWKVLPQSQFPPEMLLTADFVQVQVVQERQREGDGHAH
jgi:hypothetical protein